MKLVDFLVECRFVLDLPSAALATVLTDADLCTFFGKDDDEKLLLVFRIVGEAYELSGVIEEDPVGLSVDVADGILSILYLSGGLISLMLPDLLLFLLRKDSLESVPCWYDPLHSLPRRVTRAPVESSSLRKVDK